MTILTLFFPHFNTTTHSTHFWRMRVGQNNLGITLQSREKQPSGQNIIKFLFATSEDPSQEGMEINRQPQHCQLGLGDESSNMTN